MPAIAYGVAEAFKSGRPARAGEFVSHGAAIYSYNMLLAERQNGVIVFAYQRLRDNGKAPSVTTARHMRALESVCTGADIPILCPHAGARCYNCHDSIKSGNVCKACAKRFAAGLP